MEAPLRGRFLAFMGRQKRQHIPGAAFHITARTQDQIDSFAGKLESAAEDILLNGLASSDACLLAHIVMPNHFHIVFQQGQRPLGWIMQPIMRRLTLLVQRGRGREGHVFERRFRSVQCADPPHLRRAIAYAHINAWRKSLCIALTDYTWTSHGWYCGQRKADARFVHQAVGLQLFADEPVSTPDMLIANYMRYIDWRIERDRAIARGEPDSSDEPLARAGDEFFYEHFRASPPLKAAGSCDLIDRATAILKRIAPDEQIDNLRRPYITRPRSRIRNELICALHQSGHQGHKIANFFRVSDVVVSKCASRMRYATLP